MKSKKAITTFEMLMWVPRVLFLVVVMFAIMILIRSYVKTSIDTSELEANLFVHRMVYSPTGLTYYDKDIDRVYPGIIDFDKFTSQKTADFLEKSAFYGDKNKEIGAKFLIKDLSQQNEIEIFYNGDFFKEQKKLADSGFTYGPGGARLYKKIFDILLKKEKTFDKGVLAIEIAVPNS